MAHEDMSPEALKAAEEEDVFNEMWEEFQADEVRFLCPGPATANSCWEVAGLAEAFPAGACRAG